MRWLERTRWRSPAETSAPRESALCLREAGATASASRLPRGVAVPLAALVLGSATTAWASENSEEQRRGCPQEMVRVGNDCVDRWEIATVDVTTSEPLSPYYPPHPRLLRRIYRLWQVERGQYGTAEARRTPLPEPSSWQKTHPFRPKAVSRAGVVPQGYLTFYLAKEACLNAGKRLCNREEWQTACRGRARTKHPYGPSFKPLACNVGRYYHPAFLLHGHSSIGHTDPRLNLVDERGRDPLLRLTGVTEGCASRWEGGVVYDMEGNLDEWIDDEAGVFVGGFYARGTRQGCEAEVSGHSPSYYDYSLGTRCCRDVDSR